MCPRWRPRCPRRRDPRRSDSRPPTRRRERPLPLRPPRRHSPRRRPHRRSNRRRHPRRAAVEQLSPAAPEQSLATLAFEAFGGLAVVAATDPRSLGAARVAVEKVVAGFDLACSRFRDDSELSAVNRGAGSWVSVSPLFMEAMTAAVRAAELTDGDVDPTVGQALIALGYDRDFGELA